MVISGFWTLARTAALLKRPAAAEERGLPRLLAFTDPARTPDVRTFAESLPPGAGLVYRAFGRPNPDIGAIARDNGLVLLVGADWRLAERVGADGVHLPERLAREALRLKARRPHWIVTAAAHSLKSARRTRADAAVVSAVFPSASPSAGAPMGPVRLARLVRQTETPVYALGGVDGLTAARLRSLPLAGLAGIDGFRT